MKGRTMADFMSERREVSRWLIAKVFTIGVFCGTALGVVYMWLAFIVQ